MAGDNQDELSSLRGGQKHMWLRLHRAEVLAYLEGYGEEATKEKYHLRHDTLDRVLKPGDGYYPRFTRYDELQMRLNIAMASVSDLRKEVKELKAVFSLFQDSVGEQLKQNFFLPLIRAGILLPGELEPKPSPDPLKVKTLIEQRRKQKR